MLPVFSPSGRAGACCRSYVRTEQATKEEKLHFKDSDAEDDGETVGVSTLPSRRIHPPDS
eukprot:8512072-Pyramimonas_sp.AAC.1